MKSTRRQRQQTVFGGLLAAAGIVNLLFFLILYRPARSEYLGLEQSIESLRVEVQTRRENVDRLEKLSAQLDTSQQDRQRLVSGHFIPYETAFSHIVPQIDLMAQTAGVKKTAVAYDLADAPQYGLYSLKIRIPVQGSYSNIVNFVRDIENAETMFIIETIDIGSGGGQNVPAGTEISLSLNLETYFYQ